MKRKLILFALMISLCLVFVSLFAVTVFADDGITVTYNWHGGGVRVTATPNADGTYTLRDTKLTGNQTVTLADGTVVDKVFYGWYTHDGTMYEPGATVTFTESTMLFEAYGIEVTTAEDFLALKTNNHLRLGADLTISEDLYSNWGMSVYDLNGHTLTITHNSQAIYNYRGGCAVIGGGKLIHAPETINTNDGQTAGIVFEHHSYGDWDTMQRCWIGKGVEFTTPYNFVRIAKSPNYDKCPDMQIAGTVTAKNLIYCGILTGATINIYDSAVVTLSGSDPFCFTNETGSDIYATINLAGKIKLTNPDAILLDSFVTSSKFAIPQITSGEYSVSEADSKNLALMLPETLMLRAETDGDGVIWYKVVEADCVHEWVLDEESSSEATLEASGVNMYDCSKCGTKKKEISIYIPTKTEITVTASFDGEKKTYTLLAGDVIEFEVVGIGASAVCEIVGLKDTAEFTADQIVGIEIPAGIKFFSSLANTSLEKIIIGDGANIEISDLSSITGLKEIEIEAATVIFKNIKSTTIEKISSNVQGADVTFDSSSFKSKMNITTLEMSSGSTYAFGSECFRASGLTEVIFPDDSNIKFTGGAAFYGSPNLTYAYFGRNCISDKKIWNKPFDCVYALEEVVLMDIIYIDQYVFCCNGNASSTADHREGKGGQTEPLKIYHHADTLSINNNAFANRGVLGVELYTLSSVSALPSCAYTVYQGIAHPYYASTITESTCVTNGTAGYVTDCQCGEDYRTNTYKTFSTLNKEINDLENAAYGTEIVILPLLDYHTESDILKDVIFSNGYENLGTKAYKCLYCDEISKYEDEASYPALFTNKGYSLSENEDGGVDITIVMHKEAIEAYEALTGREVEYGLFVATKALLGDDDIIDENGNVHNGAFAAGMPSREFSIMTMKLFGFKTDEQKAAEFAFGAYVIDGGTPSYIQEGTKLDGDKYVFASYNGIAAYVNGKESE